VGGEEMKEMKEIYYRVPITKLETGETRIYEMDMPWEDHTEFWWTEGNFGCDCNREILFERIDGKDADERKCGDDRFHIPYAEMPDGARMELDGERPST
jgi:hypothetical protein